MSALKEEMSEKGFSSITVPPLGTRMEEPCLTNEYMNFDFPICFPQFG